MVVILMMQISICHYFLRFPYFQQLAGRSNCTHILFYVFIFVCTTLILGVYVFFKHFFAITHRLENTILEFDQEFHH